MTLTAVNAHDRWRLGCCGIGRSLLQSSLLQMDGDAFIARVNFLNGQRYLAPELLYNPDMNNLLPADVWSFACVALFILTSNRPFSSIKLEEDVMVKLLDNPSQLSSMAIDALFVPPFEKLQLN